MRQLRPIRPMLHCWFCGGRVIALSGEAVAGRGKTITSFRCVAEGVRWDASTNLVLYDHNGGRNRMGRDPVTGKYSKALSGAGT